MLTARMSGWGNRWKVARGDVALTTMEMRGWGGTLSFELAEHRYHVSGTGRRFVLEDGVAVVAVAEGVGRKEGTLTHDGQAYPVVRTSFWRGDQEVRHPDGSRLGHVRVANAWWTAIEADLPGLPDAVGVFALGAVVLSWTQITAVATAAST